MSLEKFKNSSQQNCPFEDGGCLLENCLPNCSYGATAFDIDGDGVCEVLLAVSAGPNQIWKWSGERFKKQEPKGFAQPDRVTFSIAVGDFFRNGLPSLYLSNSDAVVGLGKAADTLLHRTSSSQEELSFSDKSFIFTHLGNNYSSRSISVIDYSGSGQHSFYVTNFGGPSFLFTYDDALGCAQEVSQSMGLRQSGFVRSCVAQAICGDASIDFLLGGDDGLFLYCPNRLGSYSEVGAQVGLRGQNPDGDFHRSQGVKIGIMRELPEAEHIVRVRSVAMADFEGSGLFDLVVTTWNGGVRILKQFKKGHFLDKTPFFLRDSHRYSNAVVGDFDNDGREEIFLNSYSGSNRLIKSSCSDYWDEVELGDCKHSDFEGTGCTVGDFTGNGMLDIFVSNGETSPQLNFVLLGKKNPNNWLRVQPLTRLGFPALGATVRLHFKDPRHPPQSKFICGGQGYLSQMEPVAHFGLGTNREIASLVISWPSVKVNGKKIFPTTTVSDNFSINETMRVFPPF